MTDAPLYPRSISDVATAVAQGADYTGSMKEFIDSIIRTLKASGAKRSDPFLPIPEETYLEEPGFIVDQRLRVHLAGMAEHLAHLAGRECPAWSEKSDYFLAEPVFLGGKRSKEHLLADTPCAFRRRLLFCGKTLTKLFALLDP